MQAAASAAAAILPHADPALLDSSVEGVLAQFSFKNQSLVSSWFFNKETENLRQRHERKEREANGGDGVQFISPTMNVCVGNLAEDLCQAGFVMTDAFVQRREDLKQRGGFYWAVRFQFHRAPLAQSSSPEFATIIRDHYEPSFRRLIGEAYWRVRGYRNPLRRPGAEGRFGVSLNFEVRRPLLDGNGNRVVEWQKDERSRRTGDKPVPIRPDRLLVIWDNRIALV